MMPKGVEHIKLYDAQDHEYEVRIPMMPKGVEHTSVLETLEIGARE